MLFSKRTKPIRQSAIPANDPNSWANGRQTHHWQRACHVWDEGVSVAYVVSHNQRGKTAAERRHLKQPPPDKHEATTFYETFTHHVTGGDVLAGVSVWPIIDYQSPGVTSELETTFSSKSVPVGPTSLYRTFSEIGTCYICSHSLGGKRYKPRLIGFKHVAIFGFDARVLV